MKAFWFYARAYALLAAVALALIALPHACDWVQDNSQRPYLGVILPPVSPER